MSEAALVVGLGNPGPEYEHTRHNIGRAVIDILCDELGVRLRPLKGVRALSAEARDGERRVILAAPTTYMNESGEAVGPLLRYYKVPSEHLVVVHDEIDLPLGAIRIKHGGSDAGHNGLASITRSLRAGNYVRVRVGVGRPPGRKKAAGHVLRPFAKAERDDAAIAARQAADAVRTIVGEGIDAAQEKHNARPSRPAKPPPRAIRKRVTVPAPPDDVFDAWTTEEGVTGFFARAAHIVLEPKGPYELYFNPSAPDGSRGSEGCTIVAFERPRFLVFTWNAPPTIPTIRAARKTRVELRFSPIDEGTSLVLEHTGWGDGPDWDSAFGYFERAWDVVLERLVHRFQHGPVQWPPEE